MGERPPDLAWVLVCACMVFLMQAGFLCVETGLTRSKNSINVALKNLTDFGISVLLFWAFGAALMFGPTADGVIGTAGFLPSVGQGKASDSAFFLFQTMFCGTAVTIVSGAVAERMSFRGYLIVAALLSGLVYTAFGHWAWNGLDSSTRTGWLAARGFVDFAGSTVVHSVGGWVALAVVLVLGPRRGRFGPDGSVRRISGSSLPLAMLGTLLLWFGWFGFNGGSTLVFDDRVPRILANTALAGSAGLIAGLVGGWALRRRPDVGFTINGSLAGLVAITASCHAVTAGSAVVIGAVGASVATALDVWLERSRIDDVVGAVPVHVGAGVWGTSAVALFGDPSTLGTGLDRWGQLQAQVEGIVVAFVWAFLGVYLVVRGIDRLLPLRVSEEAEHLGLNVVEHGETTELLDLLVAMEHQAERGDVTLRVPVEPHTEVGQIAARYNAVLDSLERTIARTRGIVLSAMDGIVAYAREGFVIEQVNPAAEAMFGYSQADVVGRSAALLVRDRPDVLAGSLGGDPDAVPGPREVVGRRADGSEFPMEIVVTEVSVGGTRFLTGTFRDITARHNAREALRQGKEAAESANAMKSQFLAAVSHELRTPLNAIIGYSEMLREDAAEGGHQALVPDLTRIHASGKHLLRLIDDILDFSKIEAGRMEAVIERFSVEEVVRDVVATLEPMFEKNRNRLRTTVVDVGDMRSDVTRARQCLFNLLSNASKFAVDGQIDLDVRREARGEASWIVFRVTDTGIGMSADQQARLFQPFVQAEATTAREFGGTGLGLSITKAFCTMMGGTIAVVSAPGRGSTFTLELPADLSLAAPVPAARGGDRALPGPAPRRPIVLVVDDDESVRDLLARRLPKEGFDVLTAASGEEGLAMARDHAPDAITLDLMLPDRDGWSVLDELRRDPVLATVPVVVVSVLDEKGRAHALGAAEYLTKPIDPRRFFDILDRLGLRQSARVLVVEDDENGRDLLVRLLHKHGHRVTTAANGRIALERVAEGRPDLVLLDLMMPELDGFSFFEALRKDPANDSILVVVLTAKEVDEADRQSLRGVARVLSKPAVGPGQLVRELRAVLASRSAAGRSIPGAGGEPSR